MLISEKGGNSSFPFSLDMWDIIHHIHQDPYFMSPIGHIGHLGLWSPTTPLCLSLATPNQPRWRWVLMYLKDMQVGWICGMDLNQMHSWRCFDLKSPRWIQDDPSLLLYVNTGQTNCDRYHHIQCGYECMWKRGRLGPGHGCLLGIFSCNAEVRLASLRPTGWGSSHWQEWELALALISCLKDSCRHHGISMLTKSVAVSQMLNHMFEMFRGEAVASEYHQL